MIVFATFFLTLAVYVSNVNNLPRDEDEGKFVPDSNFNITWIPKKVILDERNKIPEGITLVERFLLYTRSNPKNGQYLATGLNALLTESNFNSLNPTSIIIHGWQNSAASEICTLVRDALLQREPCNVICVDWSGIARAVYPVVTYKIKTIGGEVSDFVYFLSSQAGLPIERLTLIGHSLGAHIAGYAGKNLRPKVDHIIGCDPAGPMFFAAGCESRLCNTDAKFVETIQTCGGRLGMFQSVGAATYYPNGGKTQPGCGFDVFGICAHMRSYIYVAEAILKDNFPSRRCKYVTGESVQECGPIDTNLRMASRGTYGVNGVFYVPVNDRPNYGTG